MRLEAQVERTLELSRVEGGGQVYRQTIPVRAWLERLAQSWGESYGERVRFDISQVEDVSIEADPAALRVILRNLVENSLRHSKRENVAVQIRTAMQNGSVVLVFQDNGHGYSGNPRELGQIFHRGPESQGAGVGLYLVQVLMRKMKGWTQFEGRSSGFEVSLGFPAGAAHG
jgi:two-component system OmpR family sensor kinase